jgi:hypothetical protein
VGREEFPLNGMWLLSVKNRARSSGELLIKNASSLSLQTWQLHLHCNQLSELPFFACPNLIVLDLGDNQLSVFPPFALPQLETLRLQHNQLSQFPNSVFLFPHLIELNLGRNKFIEIPNLSDFQELEDLSLLGNEPMLIHDQTLNCDRFSHEPVIKSFLYQSNYPCKSLLATLYQAIMRNEFSPDQIKIIFDLLQEKDRNLIFKTAWEQAGKPDADYLQWADTHAFKEMCSFGLAVREVIMTKLDCLSQKQRAQIYSEIYNLAGKPSTKLIWGVEQARELLPLIVDALSQLD